MAVKASGRFVPPSAFAAGTGKAFTGAYAWIAPREAVGRERPLTRDEMRQVQGVLHTKDPKPQKQKVKLKRKKKEKHLRALEHPKAKPVRQKKAPKVPEAREGEYMAGEADNVFALTTVYATKAQAMRAAQAKWDKLQRGVAEFSISLATGRADIYTETPVKVSGFKRVIDEQDWTITKVTHFLNNSGFTTSLELEVRLSDVEYETEDDE